ncbi:TPA: hypothetical protein R4219_005794 [Klebsiella pneumoniae]|nr:hypothetical protein [Klebsiella pneumoniae]HED3897642.1 hypothetical protein [Klebsiella pneumoniae]
MLKKDDIIFMKSCGNAKTIIFLRGVDEKLMINASFEEIKFAINNNLQELPGVQAVAATLKIATWGSKRESQKIPSFRMMKIQSTPRLT